MQGSGDSLVIKSSLCLSPHGAPSPAGGQASSHGIVTRAVLQFMGAVGAQRMGVQTRLKVAGLGKAS